MLSAITPKKRWLTTARERPSSNVSTIIDSNRQSQRLRILDVDINDDKDKAYVTLAVDRFRPGGLFDSGASSSRRTAPLVREDGAWKIDTADLFY